MCLLLTARRVAANGDAARPAAAQARSRSLNPPDSNAIDVAGEVLNLRRDLWLFRTVYLPVLLRPEGSAAMERWQATARQLADGLPREDRGRPADLIKEPVRQLLRGGFREAEYLLMPPRDAFLTVGGRVCWFVYPHSGEGAAEREKHVRFVLRWAGVGDEQAPAPWLELRRVLPAVREFFLALAPTSEKKLGGYTAALPIIAELDPAFAAQALDRGRLLAAVEGNPTLTPTEQARLRSVLGSHFYAGCLCTSLTLVVEALANNHFPEIAPLLALPDVHADAFWCGLMPKILLATLYQKVVIVRDWARKISPSGDRPANGGSPNG